MKQPPGFTPPPGKPVAQLTEEPDELLDEALRESFPASDPIAVDGKPYAHGEKLRPTPGERRPDKR